MSALVNAREGFPKAINNYSPQRHVSDWLAPNSYQYLIVTPLSLSLFAFPVLVGTQ